MTFHIPDGAHVVVGLGVSGQAIVHHLRRRGVEVVALDQQHASAGAQVLRECYADLPVFTGALETLDLTPACEIVLSPGADPHQSLFDHVRDRLTGEMALFVRALEPGTPVIAITGSNAKSTVTTLVGEMARAMDYTPGVGGNLGTPALTLLDEGKADLFVLELSSFQLEMTPSLGADVAVFLNVSEDHLDRHGNMARYIAAKQRIFLQAKQAVVNQDDPATWPTCDVPVIQRFTTQRPEGEMWGIGEHAGQRVLMKGNTPLLACSDMTQSGLHHYANALAALMIGDAMGWPMAALCKVLRQFKGLPHRAEWIARQAGVDWVNDSKGTNVGATLAAINGIGATLSGRLVWLGGGIGKGADFTPLVPALAQYARAAIVFGRDRAQLRDVLSAVVPVHVVDTMAQAQQMARELACAGDTVLLSPACASMDQFTNYMARGDAFKADVLAHAGIDSQKEQP